MTSLFCNLCLFLFISANFIFFSSFSWYGAKQIFKTQPKDICVSITPKSYRYNASGFVKELPRLPDRTRSDHACAALPTTGVRPGQLNILILCTVQALVVVGGAAWQKSLSSVLILLPGATAWTPLASLPRTLYLAQASIVGGRIRVTGGMAGGLGEQIWYRSEVK